MNILFVSGIYPPDIGGPATYVSKMAYELTRMNHNVKVLTLGTKNEWSDKPFTLRKVPRGRYILIRFFRMLFPAFSIGWKSDIIYATGSPWDSWIISIVVAKVLGKRLLFKIVGDPVWEWAQRRGIESNNVEEFNKKQGNVKTESLKLIRNRMVRMADMIVTPSDFLKKVVQTWGVHPHRTKVIFNAVDDPFSELVENKERQREVISVARLTPWKGIDGLLRVAQLLPDDIRITIVGEGPLEAILKKMAQKKGLSRRVTFTGRLPKEDIYKRLSLANVFVLNSSYEGLPHTILEAMVSGTAVVATDVGGNSEVIKNGQNGFLVPLGDEQAMADKIKILFDDKDLKKKMIIDAKRRVETLSWQNMVNATETFLHYVNNM